MKKGGILLVIFLCLIFLTSGAFAGIEISGLNFDEYNLGERIVHTITVSRTERTEAFLESTIRCGNNSFNYFTTPLFLEANEKKDFEITLPLKENFLGYCVFDAVLKADSELERYSSNSFLITKELLINANVRESSLLPGKNLEILGKVTNIRGEKLKDEQEAMLFVGDTNNIPTNGDFDFYYATTPNIKSGDHELTVTVKDKYTNYAQAPIKFSIIPLPTELKNKLTKLNFFPEETVDVETILLDQAMDPIIADARVRLEDAKGEKRLDTQISTDGKVSYTLSKDAAPGKWIIRTDSEGLAIESEVQIEVVEDIEIKMTGQSVTVTNIGNVVYSKPLDIAIGDKVITKKLELKPGDSKIFDLSNEDLDSGNYSISAMSGDEKEDLGAVEVVVPPSFLDDANAFLASTGMAVRNAPSKLPFNGIWIILGIIIMVVYFYWPKKHFIREEKQETKDPSEKRRLKLKIINDGGEKKRIVESELDELKRRVLEQYKEEEQKKGDEEARRYFNKEYIPKVIEDERRLYGSSYKPTQKYNLIKDEVTGSASYVPQSTLDSVKKNFELVSDEVKGEIGYSDSDISRPDDNTRPGWRNIGWVPPKKKDSGGEESLFKLFD